MRVNSICIITARVLKYASVNCSRVGYVTEIQVLVQKPLQFLVAL